MHPSDFPIANSSDDSLASTWEVDHDLNALEGLSRKAAHRMHEVPFVDLMKRRIFNVLLIANPYDAFMLEDDGRVDEKLFTEYSKLGLRYPPRFFQVSTREEAEAELRRTTFELIICMPAASARRGDSGEGDDVFDIARGIKERHLQVPIVVLTPFSHGITQRMEHEDLSAFEYVFCWLGNTDLLLSMIKLMEDKMNLAFDVGAGVQMILLVEDSIRFYSSILPSLYQFVLQQSLSFATEALNSQLETLRMRGRPKIVLARSYEEAWDLYSRYSDHVLGVISDCRFPRNGRKDERAGYDLLSAIRRHDEYVPLIMESSETEHEEWAKACGASFIDKNSRRMDIDLRRLVLRHFGFGDFVFHDPKSMEEVARIRNLKDLQDHIFTLPRESLLYHISHNNVSRWLGSRALFPISEFLKRITWHSLQDVDAHRQIIFDAIVAYRKMKNRGVVAVFNRGRFDRYAHFTRIGEGSLGGKGRGIAFLDHIIKRHDDALNAFPGAQVMIPRTVVLCTDVFDEFMDRNELYGVALSDVDDEEILSHFLAATLSEKLREDLTTFLDVIDGPVAIRSSSLLEDSHYQPFAGVYSTYMIPYTADKELRLRMLTDAIKGVYASVYYRASKDYMTATQNVIDHEKMAVILQEVVGRQYPVSLSSDEETDAYGGLFYPTLSGVGRSINYYPVNDERAEEGVVSLALGLGKYIVDGGLSLRVCPAHPQKVMQLSEMDVALRETQTQFYAIAPEQDWHIGVDDGGNIRKVPVREAEKDGSLQWISSTFDPYDQVIREGYYEGGRKVISFCGLLQHGVFPLPELLQRVLHYGQEAMRRPVEIEFACQIDGTTAETVTGDFYLLQIRPMVEARLSLGEDIRLIPDERAILRSHNAIGHGIIDNIADIVYVKTSPDVASGTISPGRQHFLAASEAIATEIERINRVLLNEGRGYVLVGPGRWGSSDPWLGIPVKWPAISGARVIVETPLPGYQVEPSQGTHFFQNITSLGVAYFTIDPSRDDGLLRQELLDKLPAQQETDHLRHVRFSQPLSIKVDGMKKEGVICEGNG